MQRIWWLEISWCGPKCRLWGRRIDVGSHWCAQGSCSSCVLWKPCSGSCKKVDLLGILLQSEGQKGLKKGFFARGPPPNWGRANPIAVLQMRDPPLRLRIFSDFYRRPHLLKKLGFDALRKPADAIFGPLQPETGDTSVELIGALRNHT